MVSNYANFFCSAVQLFVLVNGFSIIGKEPFQEKSDFDANHGDKMPSTLLSTKCDPCPNGIICVPQIQCPAHVLMGSYEKPQICDLSGGNYGFCCLTGQNHSVYQKDRERFLGFPTLSDTIIEEARSKFASLMTHAIGIPVQRGHPDFMHNIVFHSNTQEDIESFQISASAMQEVITSQIFREKEHIPIEEFETNNIDVDFGSSPLGHHCKQPTVCANINSKYRSWDGICNNPLPQKSLWGAAGQPMERLLPPVYEDGVWLPRVHGVDGTLLIGAREISRTLLIDHNRPHPKYNLLVMQFGQFIAHDITQSASIRLENGDSVQCCTPDGSGILPPHLSHFACMPIPVEPQDEFYSHFNQRCINFVRLSLSPNSNCKIGYGRQRSKVTHFIDASPVYGSSLETAKVLRTFKGGKLRMLDDFGRDLLPLTNQKESCASSDPGNICFKSGDGRTNQIVSLVAIHILFAREHNRIANALSQINPQLTDEIVYQESRRIVIAELQHIVYHEYLPIIIGSTQMKRFRLSTHHHGFANDYSTDINPAVTNEFTGAAFRFGHSTVDGKLHLHSSNGLDEVIDIPDVMFNPSRMRKRSFLDSIMNTMLEQPMQRVDGSITHGVGDGRTNQIVSLVAIHILFAREHNRIANALSQINPQLTDEIVYQESRRIVIAELQHIVYHEYLPIIIGSTQMKRFRLSTHHHGFANDYSTDVNPAVTNEFTGAAFRFGHSTVDGKLHLHSSNGLDEVIDIPDVMFNPSRMRKRSFLDSIMNTMLEQPMQRVDGSITHGLSRFLFRGSNPFGLDLAALNIQRGRDHAFRSYNDYLEVSGQRRIHSFTQFPQDVARKLGRVYRHPDDIDLWVGGLLEAHAFDGLVGSTFSEIIADQFSRLKHGDRYFYEYGEHINPGAFSITQLNEIRKSSLARIICDNTDQIGLFEVPRAAFIRSDFTGNVKVECSSAKIPDMNLNAWKV